MELYTAFNLTAKHGNRLQLLQIIIQVSKIIQTVNLQDFRHQLNAHQNNATGADHPDFALKFDCVTPSIRFN